MDKSQMFGLLIIAGTMVEMLVFLFGVVRRSYMALAIPMLAALTAVNLLAVWVGWTMLTTEPELPEELEFEGEMAEP
ncbi:MAG: hypothetical protein ABR978_06600 [Dehalococcoidia bacterium]|jgi:multisubunit Na+/H+ antiporter MnhC subunit